jgi:hypothetical protein
MLSFYSVETFWRCRARYPDVCRQEVGPLHFNASSFHLTWCLCFTAQNEETNWNIFRSWCIYLVNQLLFISVSYSSLIDFSDTWMQNQYNKADYFQGYSFYVENQPSFYILLIFFLKSFSSDNSCCLTFSTKLSKRLLWQHYFISSFFLCMRVTCSAHRNCTVET